MSVARFSSSAVDHCPYIFNPGVALTVTPADPATVIWPAPVCTIIIVVPIGKAATALVGTVKVTPVALLISTCFPASAMTSVYEAT